METPVKGLFSQDLYFRHHSSLSQKQWKAIDSFLITQLTIESDLLKKTHFFHERYENLYLEKEHHADLNLLIAEALSIVSGMINTPLKDLSMSFWFNLMQPGDRTTLHRHDDWDELVSGVFYLTVPEHSGNLVLHDKNQLIEIAPVAGDYIFFDPTTLHEVKPNQSKHHRLSIGMNIGLKSGLQYDS